jgi:hypothetical protein
MRPLYEQLRAIGKVERLDLFLYTLGGATDVPYRIVTALRKYAKEWNVLIPFHANSAGTLIALGADEIIMGARGELGPIDPTLQIKRMVPGPGGQGTAVQDNVSVEDVMAFVKFVQERCKVSEQRAFAAALDKLIDRVDPVALGSVYRTHSHIRDVARRIQRSRQKPPSAKVLNAVVKTLAEKVYAHGHAVGLEAAVELGLPARPADDTLEDLMWRLLDQYERDMKLWEPLDPAYAVESSPTSADRYVEEMILAIVETSGAAFQFTGQIDVRARRQLPPNLQVALNLNLQLPPGFDPSAMPEDVQQFLQQILKDAQDAVQREAQPALLDALRAQAPLSGVETAFRNGRWLRAP